MVGAFALTCLGKLGVVVLGKIGDCFVAPIQRQFTYMCCFNSNFTELETQLKKLETTKRGVQMGVDENTRNVRVVGPSVEAWLSRANEVTPEVEGIIQDKAKVKEGCLNGWCPNLKLRYSLSRKAVKKTTVVVDLWKDGEKHTQSSYDPPLASLETIPSRDFKGFESRRLIMEQIVKALKHDEINLIGVCGMGGVGKTTMVDEVAKRAKEVYHFDEVAKAVVSQKPDQDNVQACIADMLGLKELRDTKSPIVRADLLRRRLLLDNKKILIILDDIWEKMDLEDMGFPLRGANKNFKMLYTSRIQDLWHDVQTKKEIPLELLSEDEAWQLFREKAGDSADAPDLQPIAKKIVHECGRLPLALVLIGCALSKISGRNAIKVLWEGMLDRLTCASSTPADKRLYSRLELSYEYLEDEEARRLFLLCCLFQEDEDIRIEDLARYGFGLSLFDGIYEMAKVRRRVFLIVDDLKSRYLLLDSKGKEHIKVHDVVRDMGISIASKDKFAIVSHGAVSEWPKKVANDHYIAISVISKKIKELPEGLTYPNLEFLMLGCHQLEKLPPDFFEGMEKLKVLDLQNFHGILTFQPLNNLSTLALEGFCCKLENVRVIGDLMNLEILSFRNSKLKELPEEIGKLVKLRLLDLSGTHSLERIPQGVVSRLVRLEELYVIDSKFVDWEGEGQDKGGNANLKEFESLSDLNTLEIVIKKHVVVPKLPILEKLKKYKVIQESLGESIGLEEDNSYERQLMITEWNWDTPAGRGGIDMLLRRSDCLFLKEGSNDLVQLLLRNGVDSLQQLKYLEIEDCDTQECLADTINPVQPPPNANAVFPFLEELRLDGVRNLREMCRSPVPVGSFRQLTKIYIYRCDGLGNLFQQPIVGCLTRLELLDIWNCDKMEEVIWKEQRQDVHVAPNRIEFPKLERLELEELPSLVGFCRGIDQIDLPQLKRLELENLRKVNCLFPSYNNLSSNSEQNDSFLSLFPKNVSLPNLEVLRVDKLENLERLGLCSLSEGSLFKLRYFLVRGCSKLLCVFPSQLVPMLRNLEELIVERCNLLEVVFELEGVDCNEPNSELLSPLKVVKLCDLPKLNYISKRDPTDFKYIQTLKIVGCDSLRYIFAPTVTKSIPQLRELKIQRCKMLSRVVAEENGLGDSSVDGVEFPQLESLDLCELPNLVSFFPNVNANLAKSTDQLYNTMRPQPLFNEKVAFPRLEKLSLEGLPYLERSLNLSDLWGTEVLKVSKLENLERLGPLSAGTLFKLRRFSVSDCGKLLCVFPSQLVPRLGNLEELTVQRCNLLEVVFELEGVDCNEPNPELLCPLKFVKLHDLPILNYISKRDPMGFKYIQTLEIKGCDSLRYLFAPTVTNSISQLRELKIWRCKMLSRIVAEENGMGESSADEVKFPQLESLELCDLPHFMSFFPNVNTALPESTDRLHNPMQPQSLFNKKVVIPSLKYLKLIGLENVSDLWCSKHQSSSFSKLEKLEVSNCASLRNMFHPSMAKSLVNLKELLIEDCLTLEAVVGKEEEVGGHERKIQKVEFPRLESLDLRDVPNLVSLFPDVNIGHPELADRLHNPMQPQSLFNEKVAIPSLKYLKLLGLENVSDLWCSVLLSSSFSKVEKLKVSNCTSLRNIFHPSMAGCLVNLKELLIEDCSTLEAVVGKEEEVGGHERKIQKVEFPRLESLDLRDVPNLVSLFPNVNTGLPELANCLHNPMQPQSLFNEKVAIPSLKYLKLLGLENVSDLWCSVLLSSSFSKLEKLEVSNCTSLRNIFHPSMAGCLVNLKELLIEDCSTLEAVVGKEEEVGGHGINIDKTMFPQMEKLLLCSLPNLRLFCQFTYPLELPLLSEMAILFCPSMDVFSLGKVSTPNLSLSSLRGYGDLINAKQLLREAGDDPMATSMEKPRTLDYVTDKSKSWQVAETQCRMVAMPERIDRPHKVAGLLYTNSGDGVLALGCNGSMKLWKWGSSKHNPSGKATASVVPQQWKPASGLAMTNDVTGVKLEEAVPCIALLDYAFYVISACGGMISLFRMETFEVIRTLMPPPPASTFLAFYPRSISIIAIGMEDSTIRIYDFNFEKVKSILEGHQKRITGLAFSTHLNILVSSGADAQLCIWHIGTWKKLKSVPIQLPAGKARNGDIRVQFHSNQIYLLVSHETQLVIYDPFRDRIRQCVSQDVLHAPISSAAYSCDSQFVYTSFCDGNIGVFDANSLTLQCRIAPSAYLSPVLLSGNQAVYPVVVAAHPQLPNQFAIGLTDGSVIVIEPPTITGQDSGTASSSNASNQTPNQKGEDLDVDKDLDNDVDEDALIMTRTRTATASMHEDEEDLEEKRKKEEEKREKKGKAPISG